MKTADQSILKQLSGKAFFSKGPCDLDFWSSDLKINMGHLMVRINLHAKYEDCGSNDS
jgi:hypothetical protein